MKGILKEYVVDDCGIERRAGSFAVVGYLMEEEDDGGEIKKGWETWQREKRERDLWAFINSTVFSYHALLGIKKLYIIVIVKRQTVFFLTESSMSILFACPSFLSFSTRVTLRLVAVLGNLAPS